MDDKENNLNNDNLSASSMFEDSAPLTDEELANSVDIFGPDLVSKDDETSKEAPSEAPTEVPTETSSEMPIENNIEDTIETPAETPTEVPIEETIEATIEDIEEIIEETPSETPIQPKGGGVDTSGEIDFDEDKKITVRPVKFQQFEDLPPNRAIKKNLDILKDVMLHVSVELGRTKSTIREVIDFEEGSVIELNKIAGEQVEVFVNNKIVAKGEVIVIEDKFGIRITSTNLPKGPDGF